MYGYTGESTLLAAVSVRRPSMIRCKCTGTCVVTHAMWVFRERGF